MKKPDLSGHGASAQLAKLLIVANWALENGMHFDAETNAIFKSAKKMTRKKSISDFEVMDVLDHLSIYVKKWMIESSKESPLEIRSDLNEARKYVRDFRNPEGTLMKKHAGVHVS